MSFENYILKNAMPQKKELNLEMVEMIESAPLDIFQKMEMILVKSGLKPATTIELWSSPWEKGSDDKNLVDVNELSKIKNMLEKLELDTKISDPEIDEYFQIVEAQPENEIAMCREKITVFYGSNKAFVDRLAQAKKDLNDKEMGISFGYPETAIEAYVGEKEGMTRQELPDKIKKTDFFPFIQFGVLSKDNWREEIKTAEKWANAVKANSPKIFNEYSTCVREEVSGF